MEIRKTVPRLVMGTQICGYMRTGLTNPGVRISKTLGILLRGKKTWGRERGRNVQGITSKVEKWKPRMGSNEKQSRINIYRDKQIKTDEWTTEPLKQKGDVDHFTELTSVRDKT